MWAPCIIYMACPQLITIYIQAIFYSYTLKKVFCALKLPCLNINRESISGNMEANLCCYLVNMHILYILYIFR